MLHDIQDSERELLRLSRRPVPEGVPPVLSAFDVRTNRPVVEFGTRMRAVLDAALRLALSQIFDGEDLPVDLVPDWFVAASRGGRGGREGGWELQSCLYQFDPENEFRGWVWWDLAETGDGVARVWVDSWGEVFFGCDDFRWLAHVCGGEEATGPSLVSADNVGVSPGPDWPRMRADQADPVSRALLRPKRLLQPIETEQDQVRST
ncbi:hypothetical protein ABZX30_35970 [Streptomyces sp. NPDC004542]|uniref:hypothetical protein n=1 Tax=Streptomyces sp. NPDC004542 TaxID=3154281 RepID=UPI0033AA3F4F